MHVNSFEENKVHDIDFFFFSIFPKLGKNIQEPKEEESNKT